MAKRIFITGISGFIGMHLALFLKQRGDHVVGCDNFNSYYELHLKRARAKQLVNAGIEVIKGDICDSSLLHKIITDNEVTHLVHLAAQAGVRYSMTHPESYVHANLEGFVQVLEVCRRYPRMKLIFASSSSVYGLNEKIPFCESDATDQPASLYGATKKSNELIAHAYHHLYGIAATGLRFFTVYGPWGRPDMAYFSFTRSILKEEPIEVYNHGKMQRDFTYITDIVHGTAAAIDLGAAYEIFNLGNSKPEELLFLISAIEEATGKKAIQRFLPMQSGDVLATYADISKSHKMLGFTPTTELKVGIKHFVNWYKQYYNI